MSSSTGGFFKPRVTDKVHAKITSDDQLAFFSQLSTLFRAGTPIYEALVISAGQSQSTKLKALIEEVAQRVAAGEALYASLANYPDIFRTEWVEVIRSGEQTGQLGQVLARLALQITAANELRGKLSSAMMYPAILMVVSIAAVVVMLVKVVPTFAEMFAQFGKDLPAITQNVLDSSAWMQEYGLMLFGGLGVVGFLMRRYLKTPEGRSVRDRILISLPLTGEIMVQASMQKFASNAALLLRAGLPLLETIHSMKGIFATNAVYHEALVKVSQHVERGGQVAEGIANSGVFTSFVTSMTRIGEESGTLADVLDEVEDFYRKKLTNVVSRITGSLEAIVIIFMGITVAVILCAVYLPMFSMASGVG